MVAGNLISNVIIPLRTSDTGEEALEIMNEFSIRHLPIVNNQQLLGVLSEDDILDNNIEEAVGSYDLSLSRSYVREDDHVYEVMQVLAEYFLTIVPVIDDEGNYKGLITQEDILRQFANMGSFKEPGSIIILEMSKRNYSLTEIARIIESENATVLSSFVTSEPHSSVINVTVKINRQNIQHILASFLRYEYIVKASFNELEFYDTLKDRYNGLMTYLNV